MLSMQTKVAVYVISSLEFPLIQLFLLFLHVVETRLQLLSEEMSLSPLLYPVITLPYSPKISLGCLPAASPSTPLFSLWILTLDTASPVIDDH